MLSKTSLTKKQRAAIDRLYEYDRTILVAPTGEGKTVICLTAINDLVLEGHLETVIVACPAKVVDVWPKEVKKWSHLEGLRVVAVKGTPEQREECLYTPADVYVISLNNLQWLLDEGYVSDGIIIDELSKAAGKQTARLKRKVLEREIKWRVGMTATPVSQDFTKLYNMCRIIDGGAALGTNKQRYLDTYFTSDYMGYKWTIRDGAAEQIMRRIGSLVHVIEDRKEDKLPPLSKRVVRFTMPSHTRPRYEKMRKDLFADEVEAANEAVASGKLRQIASGFIYDEAGDVRTYDYSRLFKLQEVLAEGEPTLIFYEFVEQGEQIERLLVEYSHSRAVQIQSMSHGVDGLQHMFNRAVFYQPNWSRDATEQAIGRLWRTGQTKPVEIITLVCDDTLDDVAMARVEGNAQWMKLFEEHTKGKTRD